MLGFHKKKLGKKREVYWFKKKIYSYIRGPSKKEIRDKEHQQTLETAFWQHDTPDAKDSFEVILSLTTFGERVHTVHLTLQSIFEQKTAPADIVLWLDEAEFQADSIPENIQRAAKRGVKVKFCENLRSYKKIIPTLEAYPGKNVITIDDDVMYPKEFITGLKQASETYPDCIVAYRAHRVSFNEKGDLLPYREWQKCVKNVEPSFLNFPTGAGGIYYPHFCFDTEVLNRNYFMQHCATADDIWLKAMSLKNEVEVAVVPGVNEWCNLPPFIENTQEECLAMQNVDIGNNIQIKRVFDDYALWDKF